MSPERWLFPSVMRGPDLSLDFQHALESWPSGVDAGFQPGDRTSHCPPATEAPSLHRPSLFSSCTIGVFNTSRAFNSRSYGLNSRSYVPNSRSYVLNSPMRREPGKTWAPPSASIRAGTRPRPAPHSLPLRGFWPRQMLQAL